MKAARTPDKVSPQEWCYPNDLFLGTINLLSLIEDVLNARKLTAAGDKIVLARLKDHRARCLHYLHFLQRKEKKPYPPQLPPA
jgi:hypothetical protein